MTLLTLAIPNFLIRYPIVVLLTAKVKKAIPPVWKTINSLVLFGILLLRSTFNASNNPTAPLSPPYDITINCLKLNPYPSFLSAGNTIKIPKNRIIYKAKKSPISFIQSIWSMVSDSFIWTPMKTPALIKITVSATYPK